MCSQYSASSRAQGWVAVEEVRGESGQVVVVSGVCRGCARGGTPHDSAVRGLLASLRVKCDVELTSVQVLGREFKITFLRDLL